MIARARRWLLLALTLGALTACSVSIRPVEPPTPTPAISTAITTGTPTPAASTPVTPTPTLAPTPAPAATHEPTTPTTPPAEPTTTSAVAPPTSVPPQPSAPPAPTPTPTPKPPAPAPTPTPLPPTPTPTPIVAPACADQPVRGFGLVWHDHPDVAQLVGCPVAAELGVPARVQRFQNGLMLWLDVAGQTPPLDGSSWVVILAGDSATRYRVSTADSWDDGALSPSGPFGWVWQNAYQAKALLGQPSSPPLVTDAALQRFAHGTMLWVKDADASGPPVIYAVAADLLTTASGSMQSFPDRSYTGS